jgi:uncharacterized protein YjbI with pentapeptide repeats
MAIEDQTLKGTYRTLEGGYANVLFEGCDFTEADWSRAELSDCVFKRCNLSLTKVRGARLHGIKFEDCKLVGVDFSQVGKRFFSLSFERSLLETCNLSGLPLKKSSFKGSTLRNVLFKESELCEVSFGECDLRGSLFHQCDLRKADFRTAKNYMIDLLSNKVKGAKFSFPEAVSLLQSFEIEIE